MAGSLFVTEYSQMGLQAEQQTPYDPPLADYVVAVGVGSTVGPAFNVATRFVRLHAATNAISFLIGPVATVTATVTNARLASNATEFHAVPVGVNYAVAGIPATVP
jgi:hypothetical protein